MVLFGRGIAVLLGADGAGALGTVGEFFIGLKDLAGNAYLLFVGREDDFPDHVLVLAGVDLDERAGLEIGGAGAVGVDDGVADLGLDASFEDSERSELEVDLDGVAVLGKDEGDGDGAIAFGARGEAALPRVVIAEERVLDGGRLAVPTGGHDVPTKLIHGAAPRGS